MTTNCCFCLSIWLGIASLYVGAIGLPSLTLAQTAPSNIVPDGTLGAERSQVTVNRIFDLVEGGAQRGQNLFHSFSEFNVGAGRGTYFAIPNGVVRNVLARVTGGNRSEIFGTLGMYLLSDPTSRAPGVNLFLINPNGIVFGQGAQLDVGGSFVATTANAIQFGDREDFSASTPETPSTLLTINPSAFFFNTLQSQPIVLRSQPAQNQFAFLAVPDNQSLVLLGGDISLDGMGIFSQAGRVELGGLAGSGIVELSGSGRNLSLSFPNAVTRSNVSLANQAFVDVTNGGSVAINAERLDVEKNSLIGAFKIGGFGTPAGQAGEITLNVAQSIVIDNSTIGSEFNAGSISGDGSNILIQADSLALRDGARISASTFGQGNAGNINASIRGIVTLDGVGNDGFGGIFSSVGIGGVGRGGNLNLNIGGSLTVVNGAQISAATFGQGDAGNINAFIAGDVTLNGISINGFSGGISSRIGNGGVGRGGDLTITIGGSLAVANGAQISASTSGQGDAGNIKASILGNVTLSGADSNGFTSGIFSAVDFQGVGEGGNIFLTVGRRFLVVNGAQVSTATFGQGNAGNLDILARDSQELIGTAPDGRFSSGFSSEVGRGARGNGGNLIFRAGRLEIREGATISTSTFGIGNAGNLTIDGLSVSFDGQSASGFSSGAFSDVSFGARGNGGALNITANSLSVTNGAQINVSTGGQGNAGNLDITGRSITLEGVSLRGTPSGLFAQVSLNGVGNGGDIRVATETLNVIRGAVISASTFGRGDGGNIDVQASEDILLIGSNTADLFGGSFSRVFSGTGGIFSTVSSNNLGNGGNIRLSAGRSLTLKDGSQVSSQSFGSGDGGDINIFARRNLTANNSFITATSTASRGGKIDIESRNIFLSDSDITTNSSTGVEDGGSIRLTARAILALGDSDIIAFTRDGRGGNITFNTLAFFGQNYNPFLPGADPSTLFSNGRVDVNASGKITPSFITFSDTTFTQLSQNLISSNMLLANSCLVRSRKQNGKFFITGSGGLPQRPGDAPLESYPTGEVRGAEGQEEQGRQRGQGKERGERGEEGEETYVIQNPPPGAQSVSDRPWKIGDPIVEPQGVYRLANGELVMSRECP